MNKIIEDIELKVRSLISERIELQRKLSEKENDILNLQKQLTELSNENERLIKKERINNLGNIVINNSDISESKVLINDLLKKINRSISIISKDNNGRKLDTED
ncbi:MAG: hypothetical protein IJ681_01020 [Bacteroidales bacterium]|nr:hypothetical protein [Bacteroidales bacterium]